MGANSKIEWCHHTFNPWIGCSKVSPGCANCYAEALCKRTGRDFAERRVTSEAYWKQPVRWDKAAARAGERYRVFCGSMCDVMEPRLELYGVRMDLGKLIRETPNLDWLLLTKRPERAGDACYQMFGRAHPLPSNVWLGVTAENQEQADRRIPLLRDIPARVHFVSYEPALGPLPRLNLDGIDWVIAGGESGSRARPAHPDWFRGVRDQCASAGVPFLFKQWGEWAPRVVGASDRPAMIRLTFGGRDGQDLANVEDGGDVWWMQRYGKTNTGRLLDGREHMGYPCRAQ